MKDYITPILRFIRLELEDVLSTSGTMDAFDGRNNDGIIGDDME